MTNTLDTNTLIDHLPGYLGWKDKNSYYLGCNSNLARILKLKNSAAIFGLKDEDLGVSEESLQFYRHYDQLALSGKTEKILHNIGAPNKEKSFLLEKKPLMSDSGNIIGMMYYCQEVVYSEVLPNLQHIDQKFCPQNNLTAHYRVAPHENPFQLSNRELESLFCILRGMSAKKSGEILGLSKRTIEFYLENIKNKLGCLSKAELLVTAINAGYMNIIPARFVTPGLEKILS